MSSYCATSWSSQDQTPAACSATPDDVVAAAVVVAVALCAEGAAAAAVSAECIDEGAGSAKETATGDAALS